MHLRISRRNAHRIFLKIFYCSQDASGNSFGDLSKYISHAFSKNSLVKPSSISLNITPAISHEIQSKTFLKIVQRILSGFLQKYLHGFLQGILPRLLKRFLERYFLGFLARIFLGFFFSEFLLGLFQ